MTTLDRTLAIVAMAAGVAVGVPGPAFGASYGTRSLRAGMHGSDVKQLQRYLGHGGHKVSADGDFGPQTTRALRRTERDLELRPDAVASTRDQRAIQRSLAPAGSGGARFIASPPPAQVVAGEVGTVSSAGYAVAPARAPSSVKAVIAAGNAIAKTPYKWGGGHASFNDSGYDCSGSVSYALHAAQLVTSPMVSGGFGSWGQKGPGGWITVYSNPDHVYMTIAGLRFDTSAQSGTGSRWTNTARLSTGFHSTHPVGL